MTVTAIQIQLNGVCDFELPQINLQSCTLVGLAIDATGSQQLLGVGATASSVTLEPGPPGLLVATLTLTIEWQGAPPAVQLVGLSPDTTPTVTYPTNDGQDDGIGVLQLGQWETLNEIEGS
jgi:hypothetical protein